MPGSDRRQSAEDRILHDWLREAPAPQRHWFAAWSNYDGNQAQLEFLVDDPRTDRATALLIYWYLGARTSAYYKDLIARIEARFLAGFYADNGIGFDPDADALHGAEESWLTDDGSDTPAPMRKAIAGAIIERPDGVEDGEAVPTSVLNQIDRAWRIEELVPHLPTGAMG